MQRPQSTTSDLEGTTLLTHLTRQVAHECQAGESRSLVAQFVKSVLIFILAAGFLVALFQLRMVDLSVCAVLLVLIFVYSRPLTELWGVHHLQHLLDVAVSASGADDEPRLVPRCGAGLTPPLLDFLIAFEPVQERAYGPSVRKLQRRVSVLLPYLSHDEIQALTERQRAYPRRAFLQPNSNSEGQVAALLTLASAQDRESVPLARALLTQTSNDAVRDAV